MSHADHLPRLNVEGTSAVAILLQCGEAYASAFGQYLSHAQALHFPRTGFLTALQDAGLSLVDSVLKSTSIPRKPTERVVQMTDLLTVSSDNYDDVTEEFTEFMREQAQEQ